jgi:hypothetical protein
MGIQHMAAKAQKIGITAKYPPLSNPDSLTEEQLAADYEKSGNKKRYIPYEGIGIEDDINNPEGLPEFVSFFRLSCALFRHVFMQAQAHFMNYFLRGIKLYAFRIWLISLVFNAHSISWFIDWFLFSI